MMTKNAVTVLGLGSMGSALASTLIERGYRTTVWNRTPAKADPLAAKGAIVATAAAEAVAASPLTVMSLLDRTAVTEVLNSITHVVAGAVIVNLTSGSPADARHNAEWAREHGAKYIGGALLGDPSYAGTASMKVSLSGDRGVFDAHRSTIEELGTATFYGEDAGLAAVEFMAQVAIGYEFLIGLLHTFQLVHTEGVDVEEFAARAAETMTGYAPLVSMFGAAIASGDYAPDLGDLNVQVALMDDLIDHREAASVDTTRMREVRTLMQRRIADGHGDEGFSSLFELLGSRQTSSENGR
ncbi:3-hydroxyisobutyrate dehydrogenase-like beta-hydroxyacid dehydrogenase [Microbacterium ginsengiterrae]|uniref:3-hydroxyisobutyrate dehydrogenase-like beta-hydroxyacid dehydrogenase n=1 Tax=Microbacterium ginsengiterrae TaxID=546115 RepID=A0A7W9CCL7_9MICO|nr:NAD(P)-binding domain-containing protein [Microbacterium ginsengiterrae]MBB5743138.1 3-hydroxyisobutyrate dehydrogenase-like beta-hydroxyacid dehydrogenase [Microbacterium ginsengiterrae]